MKLRLEEGCLSLAVIGASAVLAEKMSVQQGLGHGRRRLVEVEGFHCHLSDDLEGKSGLPGLFSAVEHAIGLGCRRPALVLDEVMDRLVEGRFTAGFLLAQQVLPLSAQ
ncbi:hypothetical protein [Terrimicrobium sacchariphilum]|uniref:hypothetical protein n=1 Tax=Terrimicrobium sacchariphilum TaxID=690879 RepID=UPI001EDC2565|nr:hypothetical protein [Terrimicrobium sacchariphilum]